MWAELNKAHLIGGKLNEADLRGAKLNEAHLIGAKLAPGRAAVSAFELLCWLASALDGRNKSSV